MTNKNTAWSWILRSVAFHVGSEYYYIDFSLIEIRNWPLSLATRKHRQNSVIAGFRREIVFRQRLQRRQLRRQGRQETPPLGVVVPSLRRKRAVWVCKRSLWCDFLMSHCSYIWMNAGRSWRQQTGEAFLGSVQLYFFSSSLAEPNETKVLS